MAPIKTQKEIIRQAEASLPPIHTYPDEEIRMITMIMDAPGATPAQSHVFVVIFRKALVQGEPVWEFKSIESRTGNIAGS